MPILESDARVHILFPDAPASHPPKEPRPVRPALRLIRTPTPTPNVPFFDTTATEGPGGRAA